jgi:trk system potassium uptake protein TrkA
MRAVIVGCGRVGAGLAERLAGAGHEVTVIDVQSRAFDRLPAEFAGNAVRGDGTDEDVLRRAGAEGADLFFALTEGDNRNVLAAQLASESLGIHRTVAKINDPVRAKTYTSLGLAVICRTELLIDALQRYVDHPDEADRYGVQAPTGSHHDLPDRSSSAANGRKGTGGASGLDASALSEPGAAGRPGEG